MTDYMILLPGDEQQWEGAGPQTRQAVYAQHVEFARLLDERGHHVLGGAELRPSRDSVVVRGSLDDVRITHGPYAETVEQLSGYYLVRSDDEQDLLNVCGILAGEGGLEVRRAITDSDPQGPTGGVS